MASSGFTFDTSPKRFRVHGTDFEEKVLEHATTYVDGSDLGLGDVIRAVAEAFGVDEAEVLVSALGSGRVLPVSVYE